jgi:tripartite-type tricarboxylate transporter receptor subunit TctC
MCGSCPCRDEGELLERKNLLRVQPFQISAHADVVRHVIAIVLVVALRHTGELGVPVEQNLRVDPLQSVRLLDEVEHASSGIALQTEGVEVRTTQHGKMSYAHVGVGSLPQLVGELFKSLAGLPDMVQVPYRGAGPALNDLIGGQTAMAVVALTGQVIAFHRSGKLRVLAVTTAARPVAAPEFLTAAESGFPGLTLQATMGFLAPAGTPRPIVEQIAQATRTALAEPAYQDFLIESGYEPVLDSSPEEFRRTLEQDVTFWTPIVKQLGLKID